MVSMPKVGEQFTEFYILGMNGKAEGTLGNWQLGKREKLLLVWSTMSTSKKSILLSQDG